MNKNISLLRKNEPLILSIISSLGVIATAIKSALDTPKALERMKEARFEKGEKLTAVEKAAVILPVYAPTIIFGASTIGCIAGSHFLNRSRQASLASAVTLTQNVYRQYRNKLIELYGDDVDDSVMKEVVKAKPPCISTALITSVIDDDYQSGDTLWFYDEWSDRVFESTMLAVVKAEYYINRNYAIRGYANLDEFYSFLGLPETEDSKTAGWSFDVLLDEYEASFIDFNHKFVTLDDGRKCCLIESVFPPSGALMDQLLE